MLAGYRDVQGVQMPATRRIYAYDESLQKVAEPLLVSLDFGQMRFNSKAGRRRLAARAEFTSP